MHLLVDPDSSLWHDPQRTWAAMRLAFLADAHGLITATPHAFATQWGVSSPVVRRLLRALEAGGWLPGQRGPGNRLQGYQFSSGILSTVDPADSPAPPEANDSTDGPPAAPVDPFHASRTAPPSDAAQWVHRHADRCTARFGQPFPVAGARDTQILKRLLRVYPLDGGDQWQAVYLAQPLDSFAATRGFSIPQFAAEIAGMGARDAARAQLTDDPRENFIALQQAGGDEATALTLVMEYSASVITDPLPVHAWRQQQGLSVSASRLVRAIRAGWSVPEAAQPVVYPLFPISAAAAGPGRHEGPTNMSDNTGTLTHPHLQALLSKIVLKV